MMTDSEVALRFQLEKLRKEMRHLAAERDAYKMAAEGQTEHLSERMMPVCHSTTSGNSVSGSYVPGNDVMGATSGGRDGDYTIIDIRHLDPCYDGNSGASVSVSSTEVSGEGQTDFKARLERALMERDPDEEDEREASLLLNPDNTKLQRAGDKVTFLEFILHWASDSALEFTDDVIDVIRESIPSVLGLPMFGGESLI